MKKLYVYSDQNDNNSLGNLAHLLINSGFNSFSVGLTRLIFEVAPENADELQDKIKSILIDEVHFISVV